jgi:hypothetical protein
METNQPTTTVITTPPSRGLFGTRIPPATAFAIGILLFLLPFAQIRCNNTTLAENSGLGIALKQEWKTFASNFGEDSRDKKSIDNSQTENASYYAIVALALAAIGLILALLNIKWGAAAAGILSFAALIGLMIDLKRIDLNSLNDKPANSDFNLGMNMKISLQFTPWFWIAVILFLAAAIFSIMMQKPRRYQPQ